MSQQPQSQEPQQKTSKFLNWLDQRLIGPLLGALITAIVSGRIVILITGVQFNIGLMVLVTLIILVVMAVSFFLGMGYIILAFCSLFTKQKPPLPYRIVANISLIVLFPLWLKHRKNKSVPGETFEQVMERFRREQESKAVQK